MNANRPGKLQAFEFYYKMLTLLSVTHLHNDTIPKVGGDTLWASGYAAYEKLSPGFRKIIDGREAVYRSAHPYLDRENPTAGPKFVERTHPLVRVHPATGWKALWVNRAMTVRIVGLDKAESDVILNYLYDVYEKNVDIQVRFRWTPGTSALWDNRCDPLLLFVFDQD
jgi:alpha-ketoglutarate-dependent taurine dioxygenase